MTNCTESSIGVKLHAYELNLLRGAELEEFEQHLLQCSACVEELKISAKVSTVLRVDAAVQSIAAEFAIENKSAAVSRLWDTNVFVLLRPALLLIVIAILIYPAYLGMQSQPEDTPSLMPVEAHLSLVQTRDGGPKSTLSAGKRTALTVMFPNTNRKDVYRLEVMRIGDSIAVYSNAKTSLDESLTASVVVEPNSLKMGDYIVRLRNLDGSGDWLDIPFQVVD